LVLSPEVSAALSDLRFVYQDLSQIFSVSKDGSYILAPTLLPRPCNNLHRHIHCLVGLGIDSRLLSTQSHPSYPSVKWLSFDFETVKTFILCLSPNNPTHHVRCSSLRNDSFTPPEVPVHGIAVAFTDPFCQMLHVVTQTKLPIVTECVTDPDLTFGMS